MNSINIPVEIFDAGQRQMGEALLRELLAYLQALVECGECQTIDLHGLPLDETGQQWLKDRLGRGEVVATLDSMGQSTVYETTFSGIWWVSHHDPEGKLISEFLEVCWIPGILQSQRADVEHSLALLEHSIKSE
jgi:hydrogenase-1 operon protein HyaF